MPPVVIDNPILVSPFLEPTRHFRFEPGHGVGLVGLAAMQRELGATIGPTVDRRTPNALSPHFRDVVRRSARLQDAA